MMMVVNFDDTPGDDDDDDGQDGDCDVGFWLICRVFFSTLAWLKEDYEDVKYDIRIL